MSCTIDFTRTGWTKTSRRQGITYSQHLPLCTWQSDRLVLGTLQSDRLMLRGQCRPCDIVYWWYTGGICCHAAVGRKASVRPAAIEITVTVIGLKAVGACLALGYVQYSHGKSENGCHYTKYGRD